MNKTLAAAAAAAWIVLASCGKSVEGSAKKEPAPLVDVPKDAFTITPNPRLLAQLRVGQVEIEPLDAAQTVAARIEVDENRMTRVGSPVMGRITAVHAQLGDRVERGQTLAVVSSTVLSEGQLAFLRALTHGQTARRAVERAQILLKAEVIGIAELQRREAELAEAEAEGDAARDQLLLLGMSATAIDHLESTRKLDSTALITASMGGIVLARNVTLGQVVQPADSIFEIADLSSVLLVADVPSPEATNLTVGQRAEALIGSAQQNQPTKVSGRIAFVSSTVDPDTRTVRVRMPVSNSGGRLRPAMLATLQLHGPLEQRPCVPLTALVRDENREHVFVATRPGTFTLLPVTTGLEHGNCRVLVSGLAAGERIVLDGAFHLNNERLRQAQRGSGE